MGDDMGISVVLLAYREEENLRVLLPKIKEEVEKCGEEYEILVVDTAKPLDNTKDSAGSSAPDISTRSIPDSAVLSGRPSSAPTRTNF